MGKNKVIKNYTTNDTWTAPAGVKNVKIVATRSVSPFQSNVNDGQGMSLIDPYGNLYLWGLNTDGELGDNTVTTKSSPTLVLGRQKWKSYTSVDQAHPLLENYLSVGINDQGWAYAWGLNLSGEIGDGSVIPKSSPVAVLGSVPFKKIQVGFYATSAGHSVYGLAPSGDLYAWGINGYGQLGLNDVTPRSSPVIVVGGYKFKDFVIQTNTTTGSLSVIGLASDGNAYGWGANDAGQAGINNNTNKSSPTLVVGGYTFKKIVSGMDSVGSAYFLGLTTSGSTYGWGWNTNGNLGCGNVLAQSSPTLVLGGHTFVDIFGGFSGTSFGLKSDGSLYGWGFNADGEIGDGTVVPKSSPVAVLGGHTFVKFYTCEASSVQCSFGVDSSGDTYSWGDNHSGILGHSDTIPKSSPVIVVGGYKFVKFKNSGFGAIAATTADGKIYTWGNNSKGQLGDGTNTLRSSPAQLSVAGFTPIGNSTDQTQSFTVDVTPGTTYTIAFYPGLTYFDSTPLLPFADTVTLEYFV